MPECIEVKWTSDCLEHLLKGSELLVLLNNFKSDKYASKELIHSNVVEIFSIGKQLFIELKNTQYVNIHFGLTGYLSLEENKEYLRHTLIFKKGEDLIHLYYYDKINFGDISVLNYDDFMNKKFSLGIDIFNPNLLTLENFKKLFVNKRANICSFLINQKVISGIGNYLKCEILYHAKISPFVSVSKLSDSEIQTLYTTIKKVIYTIYLCGFAEEREEEYYKVYQNLKCDYRSMTKDYLDVNYQLKPYVFEVYKRKFDSKGKRVYAVITPDNRTTYTIFKKN